MTIDERLQFLLQSTESHHRTVLEMAGQMQENSRQIAEHSKQLQLDAEHIRALLRIAELHEQA